MSIFDIFTPDATDFFKQEISMPNAPLEVMDMGVCWTDLAESCGYRLQQNHFTRHARILDSRSVRVAWGTMAGMEREFRRLIRLKREFGRGPGELPDGAF